MTKSSMSLFGNAMRSCTSVVPLGLALGNAEADDERHRRAATRRSISSGARRSQRAIVLEAVLARLGLLAQRSRARPAVQKQRYAAPVSSRKFASRWWRARSAPWWTTSSSQSRPSHSSPSKIARVLSSVLRALSVSSMRRRKTPPSLPRVQPVEQRRARAADVEVAGGRGREANAWWSERIGHSAGKGQKKAAPPIDRRTCGPAI